MKRLLYTALFLLFFGNVNAQNATTLPYKNVYAVIIGISDYQPGDDIPPLKYAHRDAEAFVNFLKSKAGGSVPSEHIRLLTNQDATVAAVYNALDWLTQTCSKDDLVYFYFAGHGDKESQTIFNLGFLLTYNTPRPNYTNNALRIEDLNNIANTLSVKNNAKVVLITDACHSGDLSTGAFHNSALVGESLIKTHNNEVRIMSCQTDQLSAEDKNWGGGRGVFSYYLVNGLKGLANRQADGFIRLSDIRAYMDSCFKADQILISNNLKQDPVVTGESDFKLAKVDKQEIASARRAMVSAAPIVNTMTALPRQGQEYLLDVVRAYPAEDVFDFYKLDSLPGDNIVSEMIDEIIARDLPQTFKDSLRIFAKDIRDDKDRVRRFGDKMVEAIHNRGQEVINSYLKADDAELERRRYYNISKSGYDEYPYMFSVAAKLTSNAYLRRLLQFDQHYFRGSIYRWKIAISGDQALIRMAMAEQQEALKLDDNAACVQNELGVLNQFARNYKVAENYYVRATQIAPDWAVPWANMSGLYILMNRKNEAKQAVKIADSLHLNLISSRVNSGMLCESERNFLLAEEHYRTAIDVNSRPFQPFERLGFVYSAISDYAASDSFFYEAEKRKKGYYFDGTKYAAITPEPMVVNVPIAPCPYDSNKISPQDVAGLFNWAMDLFLHNDFKNAKRIFDKIILADKINPLVYHYYGKLLYREENWERAEVMFKLAKQCYLDSSAFARYCDDLSTKKFPGSTECFVQYFSSNQYYGIEDHYYLASVYEKWGHDNDAELEYRLITRTDDKTVLGAYVKLWKLLEKQGRIEETEKVITAYGAIDPGLAHNEKAALYTRMIDKEPNDWRWPYKLGLLYYENAQLPALHPLLDTVIYFPVINKEMFIGLPERMRIMNNDSFRLVLKDLRTLVTVEETPYSTIITGTQEYEKLAPYYEYTPRKKAVFYMARAASLMTDLTLVSDLNFKIGNVYVWAGSEKMALPFYAESIKYNPGNVGARMKLISLSDHQYKYSQALNSLNYLLDNKQIDLSNRLLLADYSTLAGEYLKAKNLLDSSARIFPYAIMGIKGLYARLLLLSDKPKQAIPVYKDILAENIHDANTMYTIARLYLQSGEKAEAWKWLERSIQNGFNYYYVITTDSNWFPEQSDPKWKVIVDKINLNRKRYTD